MADRDTFWVTTDPNPEGVYVTTIEINDDRSIALDRDGAMRYATAVLTAGQRAEYDAAVFRQLTKGPGFSPSQAAGVLDGLRKDRPPLDPADTASLAFTPGVSALTGEAFVAIHCDGRQIGQFSADGASRHALQVLQVAIAADLDGAFLRWLRTTGLDEARARATVGDLRTWRPAEGDRDA